MLFLISPAKTLDFESSSFTDDFTQASFLDESSMLIDIMRTYTSDDLSSMMKVSEKIANLNVERFQAWQRPFNLQNAKQAIFAFKGDVYTGLAVETMDHAGLEYLQHNLRILSGLYGLLRPMDQIQPYRLEMGTKFANARGANLYDFWGEKITAHVNKDLKASGSDVLVNLASNEYFNAVDKKAVNGRIITPVFKDEKNGQYKIISFYAKKARGLMAAYIMQNKINSVEALSQFDVAGYRFVAAESDAKTLTFKRSEQDLANV